LERAENDLLLTMNERFAIVISSAALVASAITAWLTLFRRGTIKMTQPTIIFFGPDGVGGPPKVFLRTLLYSTSKRGQIIETMYVKLGRGESSQNFNVWVYGDRSLARGSGLFVGENGVAKNHHFLLPKDGTDYRFLEGKYQIEVYVSLVNRSRPFLLGKFSVTLSEEQSSAINEREAGVFFDWGPDLGSYQSHVDFRPQKETLT